MKKRIIHSDLMRKLDNEVTQNPVYQDSMTSIKDVGFRYLVGETVQKDDIRRKAFLDSTKIK